MSTPAPLNTRLAQAIVAARVGYARPPAMGDGPRGRLFERRMQASITKRLSPDAHAFYIQLRDGVRNAVAEARRGEAASAEAAFERSEAFLLRAEGVPADERRHVHDLSRSWIDQAYAFHAMRRGEIAQAEGRLRAAMSADHRLEAEHGHDLMHIGRVHVAHLWLRLLAAQGKTDDALDVADAIIAYVNGWGRTIPFGQGWSADLAASIPDDLASAMTCRIAGECGAILAPMDPDNAALALKRLPAIPRLTSQGVDKDVSGEIAAWGRIKQSWCAGRSDLFLTEAHAFLMQGLRQTSLWYSVLLDVARAAQSLRASQTHEFVQGLSKRVIGDPAPWDLLPGPVRGGFKQLSEPRTRYFHKTPKRPFHLICAGLPRSGTTSLFTLFDRFNAGNEYAEMETIQKLVARHQNALDQDDFDAFLIRRDRESGLAMDAASFMHLALDRLVPLFPKALFVLPVRDPYSWFESYLKMLLRWYDGFKMRGKTPPGWMQSYGNMLFGHFAWEEIATPRARADNLDQVAERFLTHWSKVTMRALDLLPPERCLILRTEDLSNSRGRLAAFAGIPVDELSSRHHSNASPPGLSPIPENLRPALRAQGDRIALPVFRRLAEITEPA